MNPDAMELKMFIGTNFIDALPVSFSKITLKGYLEDLCGKLAEKHMDKIEAASEQPLFYIDHVPSSMNFDKLKKKKKKP